MPDYLQIITWIKKITPLWMRGWVRQVILRISLQIGYPLWKIWIKTQLKPIDIPHLHRGPEKQAHSHFLIFVPFLLPGGSFQILYEMLRSLTNSVHTFSIHYTIQVGSLGHDIAPFVTAIEPLPWSWKGWQNRETVNSLVKRHPCKAIILHDIDLEACFFLQHLRFHQLPVILWLHYDTDTLAPYRRLLLTLRKYFDRYIVVNQAMRATLCSKDYGISETAVHVIPNGIDTEWFNPERFPQSERANIRSKFNIAPDQPVVAFIARFEELKNPLGAIEIFELVLQKVPRAILVMAGDGHLLAKARALVEKKQIVQNVRFLGHTRDVRPLLAVARCLIAPSLSESFGLSIAEAMAMEVPVCASNRGGINDLVREGVDGYLVSPNDIGKFSEKASELITDQNLARTFGRAGRQRILESYPLNNLTESIKQILAGISDLSQRIK